MGTEFFRDIKLSKANCERLAVINEILEEYQADGYVLTLRQLYYQLVSRAVIPNQQREYSKLSTLLKEGRMAGIVDWDAIEDRIRVPKLPYYVEGIAGALQDTIEQYRLDRQQTQPYYIELWIEKDALANVLLRVTTKYHIRLMVNRGYSSCSAMYNAYERLSNAERPGIILYMGDHDPSGLDMVRDITDRLAEFGLDTSNTNLPDLDENNAVLVRQVALTMAQIRKHNPPPNPAKITDPRAGWYTQEYGNSSWELDALPPKALISIVEHFLQEYMDMDEYNDIVAQEKKDIAKLRTFIKKV